MVAWRDQLPLQGKPVPASNFHQTLLFLGQTSECLLMPLCELGARQSCPELHLRYDKFGAWFKPGVFFAAPSDIPAPLIDLVRQLSEGVKALGLEIEVRRYRPHVTLFRKIRKLPELNSQMPVLELVADRFVLYQSCSTRHGVEYRELASWPLTKTASQPLR